MKRSKDILEWLIVVLLIILVSKYSIIAPSGLTPEAVLKNSEHTLNYGPSEIVETLDTDEGKILLCRYKDWYSFNTVKRNFLFWNYDHMNTGHEIDYSKPVNFYPNFSFIDYNKLILIGVVNDYNIKTIEIVDSKDNNLLLSKKVNNANMFLIYTKGELAEYILNNDLQINLIGKNIKDEVIYKTNSIRPGFY